MRIVAGLTESVPPASRANAAAVFSVIMANLVERNEERIVFGGTANLAAPDFSQGLRDVLQALEEQVVLMRLLGQASDESLLSVMIGTKNLFEGLHTMFLVTSGYGSGGETLARLAVLGPTRMDYPGTMGAVSAVARYVGENPDGELVATEYYSVLGVRRDAGPDEIKRAYRRLARELHPDVNPDPQTQERFKEITQAYEVLSDPEKRQMYDMGGDPFGRADAGPAGAGGFGPGFPFSDIMDAFFGAAGTGSCPRPAQPRPPGPERDDPGRARPVGVRVRRDPRADRRHRGGLPDLLGRGHGAGHTPGDL